MTLQQLCTHSRIRRVVQAKHWSFVSQFMRKSTDDIVSIPTTTTSDIWNGCTEYRGLCLQRNDCQCKYMLIKNKFCIPFVNTQSLLWANEKGGLLLIDDIIINITPTGSEFETMRVNVVTEEDYLL